MFRPGNEGRLREMMYEVEVAARDSLDDGGAPSSGSTADLAWAVALQEELGTTVVALKKDQHECRKLLAENSMARNLLRRKYPTHPQLACSAVRATAAALSASVLPPVAVASSTPAGSHCSLPVAAAVLIAPAPVAARAVVDTHASHAMLACELRVASRNRDTHALAAPALHTTAMAAPAPAQPRAAVLPMPFPALPSQAGSAVPPVASSCEKWFPQQSAMPVAFAVSSAPLSAQGADWLTPYMASLPSPAPALTPNDVLSTPNLHSLSAFLSSAAAGHSTATAAADSRGSSKFQRTGSSLGIGIFDALSSSRRGFGGK